MDKLTPDQPRVVPRMRYRPVAREDVGECLQHLLPAWLALDTATATALPALWLKLVEAPSLISGVIEDLAQPPGQRVQGWGVSLLPPPEWMSMLEREPAPYAARRCYEGLLTGHLQLPEEARLGRLNAAGELVAQVMHFSMRTHAHGQAYTNAVLRSANESFRAMHSGYQLRAIHYETTEADLPHVLSAGFLIRPYVQPDRLAGLPAELRPVLTGMSRDEAARGRPGSSSHDVFDHQPPLFRLSATQRHLLRLALYEDHDEAITRALGVSVHGLKKLWRGIYERIADVAPDFFGDAASGDEDGKRGPEKRRQVLAYVRQRPEELRPWSAA